MQTFQITTNQSSRKRTVKVAIYDDLEKLRKDATRWTKRARGVNEDFSDCLGTAHRFEHINVDTEESYPKCGYIRLHKDHLRTGIITHEVSHMAIWIYELDNKNELSTEDNENEEIFCHILGDLCAKLVNRLYKIKAL